jgi:hypothetical protein
VSQVLLLRWFSRRLCRPAATSRPPLLVLALLRLLLLPLIGAEVLFAGPLGALALLGGALVGRLGALLVVVKG